MEQGASSHVASLLSLPPEIQTKIFSHLVVSFGKSSIQAVLKTNRQLYEVALPLSVGVFRNTVHYFKGGGPCYRSRNVQFLRYILITKPWLAKHVKTVIVGSFPSKAQSIEIGRVTTSSDEENRFYSRLIMAILSSLSSDKHDIKYLHHGLQADLKKGYADAQISLLLLTCPNIQTLLYEKSRNPRQFRRLLGFLGKLTATTMPALVAGAGGDRSSPEIPLSNLQDVFHESNSFPTGYKKFYKEGPAFFALPSVRSYECLLARGNRKAAEEFGRIKPRSSPVEEINLHCSYCGPLMLRNMLNACKALRSFEYIHLLEDTNVTKAMPGDILEAILPHSDTLECLYLNLQEDWDKAWEWQDHPEKLYIGAQLSQMTKLKKLTVGMQCLTGKLAGRAENSDTSGRDIPLEVVGAPRIVESIPDNLEYLKIHACSAGILSQVTELIEAVEQGNRFKRLTYIGLLFNKWMMGEDEEVNFTCNAPNVHLDIGYQTEMAFLYDLGNLYHDRSEGRGDRNITSRIYSENLRRLYLEIRGASTILDVPFVDNPDSFEE